ncbi:MAG: glycosyltransferase family 2 protein [Candidatus Pacebacteria bacterium]|nr:glycosyltransferase family 2 protein [Candidatus Paceibacterota bacterium]
MHLSVIIPAKNEERLIESTVTSVFKYLSSKNISHEILVVTNKSTDKTGEIVNRLQNSTVPTVSLMDYPNNGGKGFAVKEGMLKAVGDYRLFMDADNSTTINHIERMMPYFYKGYGVVIGSIAVEGKTVTKGSEPFWRILFGRMGNLFIQVMAVPGIRDTQRGFKMVTAKAAQDVFPKITILQWGFDAEMLALARKFGHKIKEVPVDWNNGSNSRVSLKTYFEVLLDTVKIRWNLLTGKYN